MATATKTNAPVKTTAKTEAAKTVLSKLYSDAESLFEASEAILFARASSALDRQDAGEANAADVSWDPTELAILRLVGYADVDNLYGRRSIIGRAMTVLTLKRKAGTPAEYQQAQNKMAVAEQAEAEQSPKLKRLIADTESRLASLSMEREQAAADLAGRDAVRQKLRERGNLPPHIVSRYHDSIALGTNSLRCRVLNLESEQAKIVAVVDADLSSVVGREVALQHARSVASDDLGLVQQQSGRVVIVSERWRDHVAGLVERGKVVKQELSELREPLNRATREAESLLNYYVDQL